MKQTADKSPHWMAIPPCSIARIELGRYPWATKKPESALSCKISQPLRHLGAFLIHQGVPIPVPSGPLGNDSLYLTTFRIPMGLR
jgi:hypothetical protein